MKKLAKIIMVMLALTLVIPPTGVAYASTKSNAEKVLKYYKKGNYTLAKKYNKKLPKKASKACVKKLSKKAKAAFLKKVRSFSLDSSIYSSKPYLWGYYLVDMDGDKKAELLVQYGTCEADVRTAVYKYKNGKAKRVGRFYSGHTGYYAYPGHAGVITVWGHMGYEGVGVTRIKKGKLVSKDYGGREIKSNWFPFRQLLDSHIKYDSNWNRRLLVSDLT